MLVGDGRDDYTGIVGGERFDEPEKVGEAAQGRKVGFAVVRGSRVRADGVYGVTPDWVADPGRIADGNGKDGMRLAFGLDR